MASEKASSSRSRADSAFTVASVGTRSRLSRPAVQPASQSAAGRLDPMTADPDEIFTKLSVREVREFEGRIRDAADAKQSELRTLVGERYRDMLGTATTVVDMSNSSHRLIGNLRKVREAVSTSGSSAAPSTSNEQSQAPVDVAGNERIYALGACLKLLMDAPEDLWRSMERERLLAAAWTFVLARVVWRDLMDRPVEDLQAPDIKTSFPFIERQWQSLAPMRKQIVQRATELVGEADLGLQATTECLASVILLDNATVPQTFSLLLQQRRKAIQSALRHKKARPPSTSRRRSSALAPVAGASFSDAKKPSVEQDVAEVLRVTARVYGNTLLHALGAFVLPERNAAPDQPRIVGLLERMQQTVTINEGNHIASSPKENHLPLPASADPPTGLLSPSAAEKASPSALHQQSNASASLHPGRVSTYSILRSMPSASILLRYLPPQIQTFTPYIDLTDTKGADARERGMSKVREWAEEMRRMCHNEKDGLAALLSTLGSVDSIARTQEEARATLAATERSAETALAGVDVDHRAFGFVKDELTKLTLAMDKAFEVRLKEIYGRKLTELSDEIIKAAASVLDQPGWSQTQTESSQFEWDRNLSTFLFSKSEVDIGGPSARGALSVRSTNVSSSNMPAETGMREHLEALNKRLAGRTPLADGVVAAAERRAGEVGLEMRGYFQHRVIKDADRRRSLEADFAEAVASACSSIVTGLDALLASLWGAQPYHLDGTASETETAADAQTNMSDSELVEIEQKALLVGRIATSLLQSASFQDALQHTSTSDSSAPAGKQSFGDGLRAVHLKSLDPWRRRAVQEAVRLVPSASTAAPEWLWEPIKGTSSGVPGKLPVQPSPDLMAAMQRLASSLHSLGADTVTAQPSIAEDVLATMLVDLASRYSKRAEAWRGENRDETSVNRGVQELWDLDFLRTVWKSAVPDESNSQAKVGQAVDSTIADVQKLVGFAGGAMPNEEGWEQHLSSTIPLALSRVRLLLAPLAPTIASNANANASSGSSSSMGAPKGRPAGPPSSIRAASSMLPIAKVGRRLGMLPIRAT